MNPTFKSLSKWHHRALGVGEGSIATFWFFRNCINRERKICRAKINQWKGSPGMQAILMVEGSQEAEQNETCLRIAERQQHVAATSRITRQFKTVLHHQQCLPNFIEQLVSRHSHPTLNHTSPIFNSGDATVLSYLLGLQEAIEGPDNILTWLLKRTLFISLSCLGHP